MTDPNRDIEQFNDTDKAFKAFLTECIANPTLCPLTNHYKTATEIETAFYTLLAQLRTQPLIVGPSIIDYSTLKNGALAFLKAPIGQATGFATILDDLLTGNLSTAAADALNAQIAAAGSLEDESLFGIRCTDKLARAKSTGEMKGVMDRLYAVSKIAGSQNGAMHYPCAQWRFGSKGRYEGGWTGIKTRKPVLFIGNTYDPVTSVVSAFNASAGFEGSVALEQNGFGVCVFHYLLRFFSLLSLSLFFGTLSDKRLTTARLYCSTFQLHDQCNSCILCRWHGT